MKKFLITKGIIALSALFLVSNANAMLIDIHDDEINHVSGVIDKPPYNDNLYAGSYNITSPYPVSCATMVDSGFDYGHAASEAGHFKVFAEFGGASGSAFAESNYKFHSNEDVLRINYSGYGTAWSHLAKGQFSISLQDLTTNTTLLSQQSVNDGGFKTPNILVGTFTLVSHQR